MNTTLYKINFKDGREFRVFCANKSQKDRMHEVVRSIPNERPKVTEIINGIHTIKQWEAIIETI